MISHLGLDGYEHAWAYNHMLTAAQDGRIVMFLPQRTTDDGDVKVYETRTTGALRHVYDAQAKARGAAYAGLCAGANIAADGPTT
jgi:hypothetical protein